MAAVVRGDRRRLLRASECAPVAPEDEVGAPRGHGEEEEEEEEHHAILHVLRVRPLRLRGVCVMEGGDAIHALPLPPSPIPALAEDISSSRLSTNATKREALRCRALASPQVCVLEAVQQRAW
eukprot:CAMPEP_0181346240 /NCGR_PEP_ID=MMETSP1101-20121128/33222_1 /TAXON_ID=46948 /ORGANISM="Rhodomonas abbreviata, Strain Caron Lab Isolate" /LENGTH=122 /DNA_ID=CAMNT_0023458339 /DNA_START=171 /DNA_END=536 /DNA_ORIENTATION=-